jgi:hypothetical protein
LDAEVDGPAQQANAGRSPSKNLAAPRLENGSRPAGLRGALDRLKGDKRNGRTGSPEEP